MSEQLAQLEKKGDSGALSYSYLSNIVVTNTAYWEQHNQQRTIDTSSAKYIIIGNVSVTAGQGQTTSFDVKDSNGNTLYTQANTTANSYTKQLGMFDVRNASSVIITTRTNYNATFTFSQMGLIS